MPLDLVRGNYETNVFKPLALTQGFITKWVAAKKPAKIVFTPAGWGTYVSTKHALESMADTAVRWLDDSRNFTKRAELRATFDALLATPEGSLDPQEMIDRMIEIVPADIGKFRNVSPSSSRT